MMATSIMMLDDEMSLRKALQYSSCSRTMYYYKSKERR